ncbi:hypothetical protein [Cellulosimicrobium phage DS1]|nr:hypothetical protein [Cellulosimicrobium phage DS1]
MVSFTSRLKLPKQAPSGEVVDVALLNQGLDRIDELSAAYQCTSTSRPNAPFPGMVIQETDTGCMRTWDATRNRWVWSGGVRPSIQMLKTDGFQRPLATDLATATTIAMSTQSNRCYAVGGFVFPENSNATVKDIIIPEDGLYRLDFFGYMSGTSATLNFYIFRRETAGGALISNAQVGSLTKTTTADISGMMGAVYNLDKGNAIQAAVVRASGGDAQTAVWGSNQEVGTHITISYEGPKP